MDILLEHGDDVNVNRNFIRSGYHPSSPALISSGS